MFIAIRIINSLALISAFYCALQGGGANHHEYWPRYGLLAASLIAIATGVYVFIKEQNEPMKILSVFTLVCAISIFYFGYQHLGALDQYYEDLLYLWMKMKKGLEA